MPKPEFGKKVICNNCGAKFYDLNRKPATCPHCGTEYDETSNEIISTSAKQVFIDDVDTVTDDNLVGSDATESIADDSELEIDDEMSEDTISLEDADSISDTDTDTDDQGISDDIDIDVDREDTSDTID